MLGFGYPNGDLTNSVFTMLGNDKQYIGMQLNQEPDISTVSFGSIDSNSLKNQNTDDIVYQDIVSE